MASYKVISNRVVGKKAGESITDEELGDANVEALIEAGHLVPAITKKKNDDTRAEV